MKVDRENLAWAAGLFDGEGTTGHNRKSTALQVRVGNTDVRLLDRFRLAVGGLGQIHGPYGRQDERHKQPMYVWHVSSFENCQAVLAMLWFRLGAFKQQQASIALRNKLSQLREPKKVRIDALPRIDRLCKRGLHRLSLQTSGVAYCTDCKYERQKTRRFMEC